MRPIIATLLILAFVSMPSMSSGVTKGAKGLISRIESRPLKRFVPPKLISHVLPSGLICYFLEDHELPLVKAEVLIRTGRIFEPEKKVGLGAILANLLREWRYRSAYLGRDR